MGGYHVNEVLLYKQGKVSNRNIMSSNIRARKSDIDEAMNMFVIKYKVYKCCSVGKSKKRNKDNKQPIC